MIDNYFVTAKSHGQGLRPALMSILSQKRGLGCCNSFDMEDEMIPALMKCAILYDTPLF